ncbi:metal-dependent hydrolase [Modestobacter sp. SYSU DS0657]
MSATGGARHRAEPRRSALPVAWPVVALSALVALDAIAAGRDWPIPVIGLLDEPAHLITAWLVLTAAPWLSDRVPTGWVLAGAVAIDLDHIPLYLFGGPTATPGGRPVTHALLTVAALALLGAASRRWRRPLLALALGVLLHLARDVAIGPGVPLLWPLADTGVRIPWGAYAAALVVVTALAVRRRARDHRVAPPPTRRSPVAESPDHGAHG